MGGRQLAFGGFCVFLEGVWCGLFSFEDFCLAWEMPMGCSCAGALVTMAKALGMLARSGAASSLVYHERGITFYEPGIKKDNCSG